MSSIFFEAAHSAYSLAQAGSVTCLGQKGDFAKDIHRYTSFFMAMDLACIGVSSIFLVNSLKEKYDISLIGLGTTQGYTIPIQLGKAALFPITIYLFYKISSKAPAYFSPKENLERVIPPGRDNLTASWERPTSFKVARTLFLIKISLSLGQLCTGENRLFSALSIAAIGQSFYASSKMQWIKLHRTTQSDIQFTHGLNHASIINQEISYHALLIPNNRGYCFCSHDHTSPLSEYMEQFIKKIDKIAERARDGRSYQAVFKYEDGLFKSAAFTLNLDKRLLPNCPEDEEHPSHAFLELKHGTIQYHNESHNEPLTNFWSTIAFLYGVLHLTLKTVQYTHPHLAVTIYKAQKVMMVTDIAAMIAKGVESKPADNHLLAFTGVSILAAAALFYLHIMESGPSFIDKLQGIIPEKELESLTIDGTPPMMYRIIQWMEANRFLFDLTVSSPNQTLINGLSALVNAASLTLFSNLSWLHFKRTYSFPLINRSIKYLSLASVEFSEASSKVFAYEITSVTTNFHFITPNNLDLINSIKALYDYTSDLFEKSLWKMWWNVTTRHGVELSRTLHFTAQIISRPLMIGELDFMKCLASWGGTALNHFEGSGELLLSLPSQPFYKFLSHHLDL